jgi:hypothetical protein
MLAEEAKPAPPGFDGETKQSAAKNFFDATTDNAKPAVALAEATTPGGQSLQAMLLAEEKPRAPQSFDAETRQSALPGASPLPGPVPVPAAQSPTRAALLPTAVEVTELKGPALSAALADTHPVSAENVGLAASGVAPAEETVLRGTALKAPVEATVLQGAALKAPVEATVMLGKPLPAATSRRAPVAIGIGLALVGFAIGVKLFWPSQPPLTSHPVAETPPGPPVPPEPKPPEPAPLVSPQEVAAVNQEHADKATHPRAKDWDYRWRCRNVVDITTPEQSVKNAAEWLTQLTFADGPTVLVVAKQAAPLKKVAESVNRCLKSERFIVARNTTNQSLNATKSGVLFHGGVRTNVENLAFEDP